MRFEITGDSPRTAAGIEVADATGFPLVPNPVKRCSVSLENSDHVLSRREFKELEYASPTVMHRVLRDGARRLVENATRCPGESCNVF